MPKLRLKKTKPKTWLGNGFGYDPAQWSLVDYPGWTIASYCGSWEARHENGEQVWTNDGRKAPLLDKLAIHLGAKNE